MDEAMTKVLEKNKDKTINTNITTDPFFDTELDQSRGFKNPTVD